MARTSLARRASFVVRAVQDGHGEVSGIVERVATGTKEAFTGTAAIGPVIARMLHEAGEPPSSPDEAKACETDQCKEGRCSARDKPTSIPRRTPMVPLRCLTVLIVGMVTLLLAAPAVAQPVKVVTESYHVPAHDPGIQLYVRNKRPEAMTTFTSDRVLLFVHGATYPAETLFDLQLDGLSWMDYIAQRGYDVYLMDVRGYGRSTRPPEMTQSARENLPIVHTDVAVKDFGTVVDHILRRRGVAKINLMAWSWGTVIAGAYTAQNSDKVERLVMYGPVWLRQTPSLVRVEGPLGAYRTVTMETARQRWLTGVASDKQKDLIPSGWFEAWWEANLEADPIGAGQTPPVVRAPNGVVEDGQRYWGADARYYDASQIRVPVLLVHAEWDADTPAYMSQALFARLTGAPAKRYVVIGEGTHLVMVERNRMHLFREVQLFLDEAR